ncbi:hypothetical protein Bca52824_094410 [Brassica carinata]|uniref:PGG domain-containing protein n=1 Tax=Brassica carinata TaxID=52824 RepID=A0A8X7TJ91_BRACI|nr:hypothetical protein Bca52824_094410 [Brassica carinata]
MASQSVNIYERLNMVAQDGDIERLYELVAEYPNILEHFDHVSFCETPLHIAAEKGKTHFAMELMTLKPLLALKLNFSGFSPMHLALQNNHIRIVRGFLAIDSSLVSIKGRGRITPLHYVAQLGNVELLSEFLFACPSSVEDLTIKCETAVHIAVKSHQFMAFKVLLGWARRVNKEEILDWKDEDGNTVFHIAASMNQTEVMDLLSMVNVKAKNLDGETAMDILQTHKSPIFPKVKNHRPLRKNKLLGVNNLSKTRHGSQESSDFRNAILVVAVLIVTATYQAGLSPPGGYWEENSPDSDNDGHTAGQMTMSFNLALFFIS